MMKKFINANIYHNNEATEILVDSGKIQAIGTNLGPADEVIDLKGRLVVPPYVDAHLHLDYVYTGNSADAKNDTGTLFEGDRKSTRLNSSHVRISYAVFCLK